jgi:hypothetical protein
VSGWPPEEAVVRPSTTACASLPTPLIHRNSDFGWRVLHRDIDLIYELVADPVPRFVRVLVGCRHISMTNGATERIRCKAAYAVNATGKGVQQTLRCASDSYRVDTSSNVISEGGSLSGSWAEVTRGMSYFRPSQRCGDRGQCGRRRLYGPSRREQAVGHLQATRWHRRGCRVDCVTQMIRRSGPLICWPVAREAHQVPVHCRLESPVGKSIDAVRWHCWCSIHFWRSTKCISTGKFEGGT